MMLPSSTATPANKILHLDFADIFFLLAVKAEAGLDLPLRLGNCSNPRDGTPDGDECCDPLATMRIKGARDEGAV
jgi:hypothetical protein